MLHRTNVLVKRKFCSNSSSAVPLIDIGALYRNNHAQKIKVAHQIGHACEKIGFFCISNHQIPSDAIHDMLSTSKTFFDLDQHEKNRMNVMSKHYPYGYSALMGEVLRHGQELQDKSNKHPDDQPVDLIPDLKESFSMGPYNPAAGVSPPIFPAYPPTFERAYMTYYQHMEDLTSRMCRAFALALNLPETWFEDKIDRHRCCIRSINYPDQNTLPNQLRASAHTDYGTMTILLQDECGGLQVLGKCQSWIDVLPVPNTFVVNIGDLMARWTNDRWVSTLHRVVDPPVAQRRQSVAFFHNINADHLVECIPTCVSQTQPAKYQPITALEHLLSKHMASIKR